MSSMIGHKREAVNAFRREFTGYVKQVLTNRGMATTVQQRRAARKKSVVIQQSFVEEIEDYVRNFVEKRSVQKEEMQAMKVLTFDKTHL